MKTIDEKESEKNKERKQRDGANYRQSVRAKWFCCAFKLSLVHLMCKVSLIFKSNLQLALSIILKEWELYESQHAVVQCRRLKIWDLLS